MTSGLCVIGRDDRCGLGTMTKDFIGGMNPDHLVIVDVGSRKGKLGCPTGWWTPERRGTWSVVQRGALNSDGIITDILRDWRVVVGFETWYNPQMPVIARSLGIKTVLFPNWEWSSAQDCANSDYLLCLSETDYRHYFRHQSPSQRAVVKIDWPACPEIHEDGPLACPKCKQPGATPSIAAPEDARKCKCGNVFNVEDGIRLGRELNWPPKTFVHIAGNAHHNRDGTREVLLAAKHLSGTRAKIRVFANFPLRQVAPELGLPYGINVSTEVVESRPPTASRKDLFDGCDCLVQPRRLGGHSLPINEAWGEGIPCLTLDLPDWRNNPYRVPAHSAPPERFGTQNCPVWNADPEELGWWLREMASGNIAKAESPKVWSWVDFKKWFEDAIK